MNFQSERLKRLPQQVKDTWQGGLTRIPMWIEEDDEPYRPWMAGWISIKTRLAHFTEPKPPNEIDFQMALDTLVDFACNEQLAGYRPGKIEVRDSTLAEYLAGFLAEVDIAVELRDKLFTFDNIIGDIVEGIQGQPPVPNALDSRGVTINSMRAFADAGRLFYQAKPWQYLTDTDLIEIESPFVDAALRYVNVLGAGQITCGLGFVDSIQQFESIFECDNPATFAADKHWLLSFDPITELPFGDADLWQDHELPVAADNAYPIAVCYQPNQKHRRPGPDILAFLEGLMRTLAETTEDEMDSGRWQKSVATSKGQMEFTLSLPDILNSEDEDSENRVKATDGFPDRRSMEKTLVDMDRMTDGRDFSSIDKLNEFINENINDEHMIQAADLTPLEQAQDVMYEAFEARGRKQLQLVRKALKICPDCADAYVLLAERSDRPQEAHDLYAQGIAAAEKTLGKKFFKAEAGHFWGLLQTRPYMRARLGLAQSLEWSGKIDEAAEHYRQMLRLNPNDNQGVRHLLVACLLKIKADDEAQKLLKRYDGDKFLAIWCYARALLTFRLKGDTATARKHLKEALSVNEYVSDYLLGYKELPDISPPEYGLGSAEEAIICAEHLIDVWEQTPGAVEWLESQI